MEVRQLTRVGWDRASAWCSLLSMGVTSFFWTTVTFLTRHRITIFLPQLPAQPLGALGAFRFRGWWLSRGSRKQFSSARWTAL